MNMNARVQLLTCFFLAKILIDLSLFIASPFVWAGMDFSEIKMIWTKNWQKLALCAQTDINISKICEF